VLRYVFGLHIKIIYLNNNNNWIFIQLIKVIQTMHKKYVLLLKKCYIIYKINLTKTMVFWYFFIYLFICCYFLDIQEKNKFFTIVIE